jgi:protein-disulfide isomerase
MKNVFVIVTALFVSLNGGMATAMSDSSAVPAEATTTASDTTASDTTTAGGTDSGPATDAPVVLEMVLGSADAPVEIVEYASFTCPHCARFHDQVLPKLKAEYIDTGKVRLVYREVYFDRFGLWAGMVARCGGEERYFGIADLMYKNQKEWIGSGSEPATIVENLRRIGKTAGISDAELDVCMADGDKAQAMVSLYEENAARDGINSTPSFLIDGTKFSNISYEDFSAELDARLAE